MKNEIHDPVEDKLHSKPEAAAAGKRRSRTPLWRRLAKGVLVVFVLLLMVVAAAWLAREPITAYVEARVVRYLNENGVYPRYASRSWLPWRGLRLEKVVLHQDVEANHPVIEISSLSVTLPWRNIWRIRALITHWHTDDATVTLHDPAGTVTFNNVTTKVILQPGLIDVSRLQLNESAHSWLLSGKILVPTSTEPETPPERKFAVDLGVIRTLHTILDIKPRTGPFLIKGTFTIDHRQPVTVWQADLTGNGKAMVWQGVPLREAAVEAKLSSEGVNLSAQLQLTKGAANLQASRPDWDRSPLAFSGWLADSGKRRDAISGSYGGASDTLMLTSVRGNADLLEFAHNFPALVPYLPTGFQIRTFPDLSLTKLSYHDGKSGPGWSLVAFDLKSAAALTIQARNHALAIDQLTGRGSFDGNSWRLSDLSGNALGGQIKLSGEYAGGDLRQANVALSNLRMKDLDPWVGGNDASLAESRFSLDYNGTLSFAPAHLTGSGNLTMENAPVVKVPLLDETYALFSSLEPGVRRTGTGNLKASFSSSRGVLTISHLAADGAAINVTGKGTVDLVQRKVDGRAEGHLRGVPGLLTSPFSKALTMKVSGPLDHITVQPLGPLAILGEGVKGVVEAPVKLLKDGVTLPGKVFDLFKEKPAAEKPK